MTYRVYRLPDGSETADPNAYGDAWSSLGDRLCRALNDQPGDNEWYPVGVGAEYKVVVARREEWMGGGGLVSKDTEELRVSVQTAEHIIGLWENQAM